MIDFLYKLDYDDHRSSAITSEANINITQLVDAASKATSYFGNKAEATQYEIVDQDEIFSGVPCGLESRSVDFFEDAAPAETDMIPTNSIPLINKTQPESLNPVSLLINAKVYIIADKYEIQALKDLAAAKYKSVLPKTWNSSAFTESSGLVYNNTLDTDRMLRNAIVQEASKHVKILLDRGEFVDLLESRGDLAVEVLKNVVSNHSSPTEREIMETPSVSILPERKGNRGPRRTNSGWITRT
jgi:hypothetical protein